MICNLSMYFTTEKLKWSNIIHTGMPYIYYGWDKIDVEDGDILSLLVMIRNVNHSIKKSRLCYEALIGEIQS